MFFPSILSDFLFNLTVIFGDGKEALSEEELRQLKVIWPHKLLAIMWYISKSRKERLLIEPDTTGDLSHTPLQLAAIYNYKEPLIAKCLADCIIMMNLNPDEVGLLIEFYCHFHLITLITHF